MSLAAALLELVWPPRCAACEARAEGDRGPAPFCARCAAAIEPVPAGCPRCAAPSAEGAGKPCGACQADPPAFAGSFAAGLFGGPLADAVHALKYHDRPALARPLGEWLARRMGPVEGAPVVVSVPLGALRRRDRGYDQAALLADAFARAAKLPRLTGALRRRRDTRPQVGRDRASRARNVWQAFVADGRVAGRFVLLVDDVITTGATADACARALRDAGARSVLAVALARAE